MKQVLFNQSLKIPMLHIFTDFPEKITILQGVGGIPAIQPGVHHGNGVFYPGSRTVVALAETEIKFVDGGNQEIAIDPFQYQFPQRFINGGKEPIRFCSIGFLKTESHKRLIQIIVDAGVKLISESGSQNGFFERRSIGKGQRCEQQFHTEYRLAVAVIT